MRGVLSRKLTYISIFSHSPLQAQDRKKNNTKKTGNEKKILFQTTKNAVYGMKIYTCFMHSSVIGSYMAN